jgi:hypothetical protein
MIFSRRIIQKILNDNSKLLTFDQVSKHVDALNRANEDSIAFEWEVILLNALSKLGKVTHEPDLGGTSRVDIHFTLYSNSKVSFIADIATVSDKGFKQENPVEPFIKELNLQIRKFDLQPNHFSWELKGESLGPYGDRKMKIKIPSRGDFKDFFDKDFKYFLKKISLNSNSKESYIKKTESLDIVISYNPTQRSQFGNYPSYTTAYSLTKNPIYNTLKRKTDQLKAAGFGGPKIVFLCDGACGILKDMSHSCTNYGTIDIIDNFLRDNSSIAAVITILIEKPFTPFYGVGPPEIKFNFIGNSIAPNQLNEELLSRIQSLPKFVPQPANDALNAINRLNSKYRKVGKSNNGGCRMTDKTIRISSRALLDLLSGRTDYEKFQKDHNWFCPPGYEQKLPNYFERKLKEGRLFSNVYIEKSDNEDDDWITFEFGEPDPAVFQFVVPKKS